MKISELATKSQINAKTIRYYEQVGLLKAPQRASNGYRHYQPGDVDTLIFIRRCRELNIPLDDIKRLVEVQADPNASCAVVDKIIAEQLAQVQRAQRELALLEQSLQTLASCSAEQVDQCTILHKLKAREG
ncbi:MerR family transcriptional regulator [Pseudoalteromonas viridis]|uniref:MerR family transcriptional regulator n=1 Tax=Pseudoalteromonas viridis TaxID=339617 RepID=A0ABX7VBE6_9GAMM|nr:MerR family transcriptional regulator [Pseudoalteromonas viridis]QTL35928.1 MerR family transcriptional regulator [Pseudoalteromonas viridis]